LTGQQDPFRDHSRVPGIDELLTTFDFEAAAYAKLPREAYQYTAHGTESEFTLRRNREAFDWVKLVPRAVANVRSVDTATEVLGVKMKFPLLIAPSSGHGALHPDGEVGTHRGASAASETNSAIRMAVHSARLSVPRTAIMASVEMTGIKAPPGSTKGGPSARKSRFWANQVARLTPR
jgi:isopentenyl diphosphate isomerase/L-lactate dehydrogenase-like FMN-dependent dehydrogenase